MRKKSLRITLKALKYLFYGTLYLYWFWIIISWMDVNVHNMNPNHVYPVWNFFNLFF